DHGVNSLEDGVLCREIKDRNLTLTVCPISNGYVTESMKTAEIKAMLEKGMNVTVNSDDPAYFPGYMNENLIVTQRKAGLSKAQVVQLSANAFEGSWLADEDKAAFLRLLSEYVA
ncbi:MAG: adenosine deaminase, partial [SAR324 cluster bacterium]|nr:adenosine deaminase [SAR324 cluster bacterium]